MAQHPTIREYWQHRVHYSGAMVPIVLFSVLGCWAIILDVLEVQVFPSRFQAKVEGRPSLAHGASPACTARASYRLRPPLLFVFGMFLPSWVPQVLLYSPRLGSPLLSCK